MNTSGKRSRTMMVAVAAAAFAALAFAAVASGLGAGSATSKNPEIAKLQRQVAALQASRATLQARLLAVGVSSRTAYIEWLGLHGVDSGFNMSTGLSAVNVERFQNAIVVLREQRWPADLKADAAILAKAFSDALAANAAGNRPAEKAAVTAAHDQYHLFSVMAYKWVAANTS